MFLDAHVGEAQRVQNPVSRRLPDRASRAPMQNCPGLWMGLPLLETKQTWSEDGQNSRV
jgi:hypothetical protein